MKKYIEDLKIGDLLSENITNVNDSIIAKKDDAITERILNILKMWGVKEVNIKSVTGTIKQINKKKSSSKMNEENYGINNIMDIVLKTSKLIIADRINYYEK